MNLIKINKEWSTLNTVKISFCKVAVPLIKFAIKDVKMTKNVQKNGYPSHIKHPITQEKRINIGKKVLFMKVEIFSTKKSAMPLSFSNFDFLPIYKADSAGSRTYPFAGM